MWKKCYFCKKLVRTIGSLSQSNSVSSRKKKVQNLKFKRLTMITNYRRFSNDTIPTRLICKKCKPKDKTQKPLEYLVKALSNTIREGFDIEKDKNFCLDSDFGVDDDVDTSQYLTANEEAEIFNDQNIYSLMTDKETVFWGGAVHTLDNISIQQGILKEFFDSAPENILRRPELLQEIFENGPEEPAERQRALRLGHNENIADLLAEQQRHLQEGHLPQHLAVQQVLYAGDNRQPELQRLLPEENNDVAEQLALHQRLRENNDNEPEFNANNNNNVHQRQEDDDVNLPRQIFPNERDNNALEQLAHRQKLFREDADNVSKHIAIELGLRLGNGKLSHSFTVYQKFVQDDDNSMHDMLIVHRSLLQQDDDYIPENDEIQDQIINQPSHFQKGDNDLHDLLTLWQGLSLNEGNVTQAISKRHPFSSQANNNVIHQEISQANNVPDQYASVRKESGYISDQQKQIALNQKLLSKHGNIFINVQLALHQELLKNNCNKANKQMKQRSMNHTDNKKPDLHKSQAVENRHQKLLSDNGNKVQELTSDQKVFLCEADNNELNTSTAQQNIIVSDDNLPDNKVISQKLRPKDKNNVPNRLSDGEILPPKGNDDIKALIENQNKSLSDHNSNDHKLKGITLSVNAHTANNESNANISNPISGQTPFSRKRVNENERENSKIFKKLPNDTIASRRNEESSQ